MRISRLKNQRVIIATVIASLAYSSQGATPEEGYEWTPDHMHVGVRWQPFIGRPENNAYDATRPMISEDSSYAQFWVSWPSMEPNEANTDYINHPSAGFKTIEAAVDACVAKGVKVEFVLWHCPAWASVSGNAGGWSPKPDMYNAFITRIATHFKGRVNAYQLYHESNQKAMLQDGTADFIISEILTKGARAVRNVYEATPAEPVLVSTTGFSPCEGCKPVAGLNGSGAAGVNDFYDRIIADETLMNLVDALNLNVSDHFDGFGCMDGKLIPSVWGNYDLVRNKLNAKNYTDKAVISSESWIVWDDAPNAHDVNCDGVANEKDAYCKAITIIGKCMERGLNTINMPWSDNSSAWAMGLTKRLDYNGRIKQLDPSIVIPASNGRADVVTKKVLLRGGDANFKLLDAPRAVFSVEDYINPSDPNHLHYYIWKWYAQLAGGSDEVIRHALAGELGNDITAMGPGYTGEERYKMASYNRTKKTFKVLLYAAEANGNVWAKVAIPSTIQNGFLYNNDSSKKDFRGEGFVDGDKYIAKMISKDISTEDGSDLDVSISTSAVMTVTNGTLTATVGNIKKFTSIEFSKVTN